MMNEKRWVIDDSRIYKDLNLVTEISSSDGKVRAIYKLLEDANDLAQELADMRAENQAFRKYITHIYEASQAIPEFSGKKTNPDDVAWADLLIVAYRSWAYIQTYGIEGDFEAKIIE